MNIFLTCYTRDYKTIQLSEVREDLDKAQSSVLRLQQEVSERERDLCVLALGCVEHLPITTSLFYKGLYNCVA